MDSAELSNFEFLDAITIVGFLAQLDNMDKDEKETDYIHKVIDSIANEIEKLHKENEIIIEQNNKILKLLGRSEEYGANE